MRAKIGELLSQITSTWASLGVDIDDGIQRRSFNLPSLIKEEDDDDDDQQQQPPKLYFVLLLLF